MWESDCLRKHDLFKSGSTGHGMLLRHKADSGPQVLSDFATWPVNSSCWGWMLDDVGECLHIWKSGWQSFLPARMLSDRGPPVDRYVLNCWGWIQHKPWKIFQPCETAWNGLKEDVLNLVCGGCCGCWGMRMYEVFWSLFKFKMFKHCSNHSTRKLCLTKSQRSLSRGHSFWWCELLRWS